MLMALCFAGMALAMSEPTAEEKRERLEREVMRIIGQLAKAFGPHAHHFGYRQHEATRSKAQSDSLKRLLGGGKRGQYKKAA
jgi:cytochrome c556